MGEWIGRLPVGCAGLPRVPMSAPLGKGPWGREERSSPKMGVFVPQREERTSVRTSIVVFGDEHSTRHGRVPREERSSTSAGRPPPHMPDIPCNLAAHPDHR